VPCPFKGTVLAPALAPPPPGAPCPVAWHSEQNLGEYHALIFTHGIRRISLSHNRRLHVETECVL